MGLFCVNFHFRTTDDQPLIAALQKHRVSNYRIATAKNGWTSLYEERASTQDDRRIRDLACDLSRDLQIPAVAFMVHDSDIACYWLCDQGRMLDEFNSCPDYFDDDAGSSGPTGGRPDVLLPYCHSGVSRDDLVTILGQNPTFAEGIVEELAQALGIDPERAITDYRDDDSDGPGGGFGADDDDDGDGDDGRAQILSMKSGLANRLTQLFGGAKDAPADPKATALVLAATQDNVAEIDRLLNDGAAVDADAPGPLPEGQPAAGLGQLFPGGMPQFAMTPLLAATVHQKFNAAKRLLEVGADPNHLSMMFGSPVHAAVGAGDPKLLGLLIDHGGDVNARNRQGMTPLQIIANARATQERLAQTQAMMKSMGMKLTGPLQQLSKMNLPAEGWTACEKLLKERGAL